ncbi:MAG TPA: DUF1934 domain-containing protein [Lachnospiraceae bacterium]
MKSIKEMMTKEIIIKIKGSQSYPGQESDCTEILVSGQYFLKNGKHYLLYEEVMEGFLGKVKNRIVIWQDKVEIHKKGLLNSRMIFEEKKHCKTEYTTPYGSMELGIETKKVNISFGEENLTVDLEYELVSGGQYMAECKICVEASSKKLGVHI